LELVVILLPAFYFGGKMPRLTRIKGRNLPLSGPVTLTKVDGLSGWDLYGSDTAEVTIGMAAYEKSPVHGYGNRYTPYWGISVVGVNNQRKSIVFDSIEDIDNLISMLQRFKESGDLEALKFRSAVR
jgi:hypothetical protein